MIGISKLYCGTVKPSDALRYRRSSGALPSHLLQFSSDKKPVVVWNVGRRCNLSCVHCYSQSHNEAYDGELTTAHAESFIDGLGEFKAPVLLFSGGEPLMRPDLFRLIRHAKNRGLRAVLSTNGTLISEGVAARLAESGLSYVGISLDGMRDVNNRFRGVTGAFDLALRGIRHCIMAGVKVGLRFTINKSNVGEIPGIFRLLEEEKIPRVCFYHLVYSGRGSALRHEDLNAASCRSTLDTIIDLTAGLHARGLRKEVLTVANHADGVYLYLRMRREGSPRAKAVLDLLTMNGREQLRDRHWLRELGRLGPCRPVLAPPLVRQCPGALLRGDLDRYERRSHGRAERSSEETDRQMRPVRLSGNLQRQCQGAG